MPGYNDAETYGTITGGFDMAKAKTVSLLVISPSFLVTKVSRFVERKTSEAIHHNKSCSCKSHDQRLLKTRRCDETDRDRSGERQGKGKSDKTG